METSGAPHIVPRKLSKKSKKPVAVSFHSVVSVKGTIRKEDMKEYVQKRYWMSAEDHAAIKEDCRQTVRKMMSGTVDDSCCTRGLEDRTKEGARRRKRTKDSVRRAVIFQQDVQSQEGICDPEFIAAISITKSKESARAAWEIALRDQAAVEDYLKEAIYS